MRKQLADSLSDSSRTHLSEVFLFSIRIPFLFPFPPVNVKNHRRKRGSQCVSDGNFVRHFVRHFPPRGILT
jgi:hypothetical protein